MSKAFVGTLCALFLFFVVLPIGCTLLAVDAVTTSGKIVAQDIKDSIKRSNANGTASNTGPAVNTLGIKWKYSEERDKMRGTATKYAQLDSENELAFGFPYGTSRGTLMLRRRPSDGLNIILTISGQFICNRYMGETVNVKFDSGPIQRFRCAEPADDATGALFIEGAETFLKRLRKASTVTIEAQYFQQGPQQLTFDVHGLSW